MATMEQVEALKQIGEWCKWLVAVESAGIGLIASFVTAGSKLCNAMINGHEKSLIIAVIAFVLSIIMAGIVVSAIPDSITDIQPTEHVMNRRIFFINSSVGPLYVYVELLFGLFLVGVIALAFSVIRIM